MNAPPTLDRFETALLEELRAHVAARPAVEAVPPPRRSRRRRWAAGLAAAAAAATAYVVVSPGGPAASPAYAVTQDADGDVVVTVHRLEDADGLEAALREHGIDADVRFTTGPDDDGVTTFELPAGGVWDAPPDESGSLDQREEGRGDGPQLSSRGGDVDPAEPGIPGRIPDIPDCGIDDADPATLSRDGDDWVLRIPADSPLQDRPVFLSTTGDGALMAAYAGNDPGSYCAVMSSPR